MSKDKRRKMSSAGVRKAIGKKKLQYKRIKE